jgi:hypothetical protein
MTSFQVKVLQKKFTLLHANFSKIVLKYSTKYIYFVTWHHCKRQHAEWVWNRLLRQWFELEFKYISSVDITVHQCGKMFYIFYNIAQRNIKKEIFRVDIELRQHGS